MSWKEREARVAAFEQAQHANRLKQWEQDSLESLLEREGADIIAEGILNEFGVAQALQDVKEGVWKEGEITQAGNKRGWQLTSDPIATLQKPYLGEYWRETDHRVINVDHSSIAFRIGVEFEDEDTAKPKLVLKDSSGTSILLREEHLGKISDMRGILRRSGSKGLVVTIYETLKLNESWSYTGSVEEVRDLGGEDASERFNRSLITMVSFRKGRFPLPGQVRDSWRPLIDQFPHQHQLRRHGFLTVGDLKSWEREVRGPSLLQRAGLLFSEKSRQPTKV